MASVSTRLQDCVVQLDAQRPADRSRASKAIVALLTVRASAVLHPPHVTQLTLLSTPTPTLWQNDRATLYITHRSSQARATSTALTCTWSSILVAFVKRADSAVNSFDVSRNTAHTRMPLAEPQQTSPLVHCLYVLFSLTGASRARSLQAYCKRRSGHCGTRHYSRIDCRVPSLPSRQHP